MGGASAEREISLRSGSAVVEALIEKGYDARAVDAGPDVALELKALKPTAAFIALHGVLGEDGSMQGLLEVMGIPYTGSGVLASALAMDKAASKKALAAEGILTPEFAVLRKGAPLRLSKIKIKMPLVVKPASEGSTIGLSVVRKKSELAPAVKRAFEHGESVLVERFIEGRELTVSIMDGRPLAIVEVRPKTGLYDYRAKYTKGMTEYIVPAKLGRATGDRVKKAALAVYQTLGCRGAARVDIMLGRGNAPYVLEINTVPGLTELSLLPKAAAASGMDYPELVERMLLGARLGA
jgi:D-alanine-D-alanine ligase